MRSDPSTLRAERIRLVGQRLREHSRQLVWAAQRAAQVSDVVIGESAATALTRPAKDPVTLPPRESIEALRAEIARIRDDNEDLRASARLWADLYDAQVKRANQLQAGRTTVGI